MRVFSLRSFFFVNSLDGNGLLTFDEKKLNMKQSHNYNKQFRMREEKKKRKRKAVENRNANKKQE